MDKTKMPDELLKFIHDPNLQRALRRDDMDLINFKRHMRVFAWFSPHTMPFIDFEDDEDTIKEYGTKAELLTFSLIFGNAENQGLKRDVKRAIKISSDAIKVYETKRPSKGKKVIEISQTPEWDNFVEWIKKYAEWQILLGTAYAYDGDYVKASYHLMKGLNTDALNLSLAYCDFARYIFKKLKELPKTEAKYEGVGFNAETPMGSEAKYEGVGFNAETPMGSVGKRVYLDASAAIQTIPEMEGKEGEILIARKPEGLDVVYGSLERKGSVCNSQKMMIDIYETLLIDKDYNLKTVRFYFNGYFGKENNMIRIADNFTTLRDAFLLKLQR